MTDIVREFSRSRAELLGLSLRQLLIFMALIFSLGIYVGDLLFGKNSLDIYIGLEKKADILKYEVSKLQNENAKLQKEYFELKMLEPK